MHALIKRKFLVVLLTGLLGVSVFPSHCLAEVDMSISGKYKLPDCTASSTDSCCSNNPADWVFIKFPKPFASIPVVIVTHEISALTPEFADSYFTISGVTKLGFNVQRRNLRNMICNQIATVNYIAVGN
jgi:hypothetical protein